MYLNLTPSIQQPSRMTDCTPLESDISSSEVGMNAFQKGTSKNYLADDIYKERTPGLSSRSLGVG